REKSAAAGSGTPEVKKFGTSPQRIENCLLNGKSLHRQALIPAVRRHPDGRAAPARERRASAPNHRTPAGPVPSRTEEEAGSPPAIHAPRRRTYWSGNETRPRFYGAF